MVSKDEKRKIIIFGAGKEGIKLLSQMRNETVECFIDNDLCKQNTTINGVHVCSPEFLNSITNKSHYDIVISTLQYSEEIKVQLEKYCMMNIYLSYEYIIKCLFEKYDCSKRILLMNTHSGTNVGDHYITNAELFFFSKYLPDYTLLEVQSYLITIGLDIISNYVKNDDVIAITGGGFLGSLWLNGGEENVRAIIQKFDANKIVILPQTLYFEDNAYGRYQKEITKKIYNQHKNLNICLRDATSMKLAKELFDNKVSLFYFPDMVTIMDCCSIIPERRDVAVCFRTDKESVLECKAYKKMITDYLHMNLYELSMREETPLNGVEREKILYDKMREIKRYKLVVTDRLHCMLLCAITGTPCIAFDNLTNKVSGVYHWIKCNQYVHMVHNYGEMKNLLDKLDLEKTYFYSQNVLNKYYEEMKELFISPKNGVMSNGEYSCLSDSSCV